MPSATYGSNTGPFDASVDIRIRLLAITTRPAENGMGCYMIGFPRTYGVTTSSNGIDNENIILYIVVSPCDASGNIPNKV